MSTIEPEQSWGVPPVARPRWQVYFKTGALPSRGPVQRGRAARTRAGPLHGRRLHRRRPLAGLRRSRRSKASRARLLGAATVSLLTTPSVPAAGAPEGLLVLHHGRGTDEQDLLRLADMLDPRAAAARRHTARAADRARLARLPLVPRAARRLPGPRDLRGRAGAAGGAPRRALGAHRADAPAQTVLGGFSMGCVMSYATGLDAAAPAARRDPRLLRVHPDRARAGSRTSPTARGLPVLIAHGRAGPGDLGRVRRATRPRGCRRAGSPSTTASSTAGTGSTRTTSSVPRRFAGPRRSQRRRAHKVGGGEERSTCRSQRTAVNRGRGAPARARRRRGLRRHRDRDRAAPSRHRGRHDPRARERPRRHLVLQHLPGRGLRRAEPPLLVLLRPAARLVAAVLAPAGDPRLPARGRDRASAWTASCAPARPSPPAAGTRRRATWTVETSEGERHEADAIVLATGQLHQPHVPLIQGAGEFAGHTFHSSSWDHDYDLRGQARRRDRHRRERRAVRARDRAARSRQMTVFQRTGNWFLPRKNRPYPALAAHGLRNGAAAAGVAAPLRVRVQRIADADDPPPAHVRAASAPRARRPSCARS